MGELEDESVVGGADGQGYAVIESQRGHKCQERLSCLRYQWKGLRWVWSMRIGATQ